MRRVATSVTSHPSPVSDIGATIIEPIKTKSRRSGVSQYVDGGQATPPSALVSPSSLVSDPVPPRCIAASVRRLKRAQARFSPARIPAWLRAFAGSDARRCVLRIPRSPRLTPQEIGRRSISFRLLGGEQGPQKTMLWPRRRLRTKC